MQNYRLRLLSEKHETLAGFKHITEAAYNRNKIEVIAAGRQLDSRRSIEKQQANTDDERKKAACEILLEKFPSLKVLEDNLELARRKLSSTRRQMAQIREAEEQYEAELSLTRLVENKHASALAELHEKFGDIDVVYKYNAAREELDIYFGGQDFPLGEGHAHWVYRRDRYVWRRNPTVEQAC